MICGTENLVSVAEAAKIISERLPNRRGGRALSVTTVYRWFSRGLRGVRLEYVQVGGTRAVSLEALDRFFERLSGRDPSSTVNANAGRDRDAEKCDRYLETEGI
jgi:hypothetical protein